MGRADRIPALFADGSAWVGKLAARHASLWLCRQKGAECFGGHCLVAGSPAMPFSYVYFSRSNPTLVMKAALGDDRRHLCCLCGRRTAPSSFRLRRLVCCSSFAPLARGATPCLSACPRCSRGRRFSSGSCCGNHRRLPTNAALLQSRWSDRHQTDW
ncbi:uncharacterized protein BKA78DRAFT_66479 [Phyllosticta capitalensis]|uniref:uncharacterized protein n=1 Tax=Phyllosticta capitalensis TaxID=121624 RepID=UPI003132684B